MDKINIFDNTRATYVIEYTEEELSRLMMEMTGDVEGSIYEFGYDTVEIRRTRNPFRRWWGGFCAEIAAWAIRENQKHGDYYMILDEEYTNKKIIELEKIANAYKN